MSTDSRRTTRHELLHVDIVVGLGSGTDTPETNLLCVVDDASRFAWTMPLVRRADAASELKALVARLDRIGPAVKVVRSDNGTELVSGELGRFWKERGITNQRTAPHTSAQNGVVERFQRTIQDRIRSMLKDANLPASYWAVASSHATTTYNHSYSSVVGQSPASAYGHQGLRLNLLRRFGALTFAHQASSTRDSKLADRGSACILLGIGDGERKGWYVQDLATGRAYWTRSAIFHESVNAIDTLGPDENSADLDELDDGEFAPQPTVEIPTTTENLDSPSTPEQSPDSRHSRSPSPVSAFYYDEDYDGEDESIELLKSRHGRAFDLTSADEDHHDEAVARVIHLAAIGMNKETLEPANIGMARKRADWPEWFSAMKEEYDILCQKGAWTLSDLPEGARALPTTWAFKVKTNSAGEVIRKKARLAARGDQQQAGRDFTYSYAPVAQLGTIRTICALAAQHGLHLSSADVVSAYLNADLEEDVYLSQPVDFSDGSDKVLKLNKALYGLHQAGREWYRHFSSLLTNTLGLRRSEADHSLFMDGSMIIAIYVDDVLVASPSENTNRAFLDKLAAILDIKVQPAAREFLGIGIERVGKHEIVLRQLGYLKGLQDRFSLSSAPRSTPLDRKDAALHISTSTDARERDYFAKIGSLLWASSATRPDLAYTSAFLGRFASAPSTAAYEALDRSLRYAHGTSTCGLVFRGGKHEPLSVYSDSDLAGDATTRKSTSGSVVQVYGSTVAWRSKLQRQVAVSTGSAEYIALGESMRLALFIRNVLVSIGELSDNHAPIPVYTDSAVAISLTTNNVGVSRLKYLDLQLHFVRDLLQQGVFRLVKIDGKMNTADVATKILDRHGHLHAQELLGLRSPDPVVQGGVSEIDS